MKPFLFTNLELSDRGELPVAERDGPGFPFQTFDTPCSANVEEVQACYSAEDLASAVDEACRATTIDVEARTLAASAAEASHRQAIALEAIRDQLSASESNFRQRVTDMAAMSQSIARLMGQAIVPKAVERHPLADITDMLSQSLVRLIDQPSIEIRLEADLVDQMASLLKDVADDTGFQGELTAAADPTLGAGEAKLVWNGGTATRDMGRIREEVDMLIDAWLDNDDGGPSPDQISAAHEPGGIEPGSSEEGGPS